ncbi:MAG: hypothetical protein V3R81_11245, partial [Gammaproteobacteria bacterium]
VDLPPAVDAGDDIWDVRMRLTSEIQLNGTYVDYGAPSEKTIVGWVQEDSDGGTATFTAPGELSTGVTFDEFGWYEFSLTVEDAGGSRTDWIEIEILESDCGNVEDAEQMIPGDISGPGGAPDCRVDLYDIAAYAADFLACNDPQDTGCDDPYFE